MKLSITVYGNPPADIVAIARRAEELGFDGIWVGDHVVIPMGHSSDYPYPGQRGTPIVSATAAHHFDSWVLIGQLIGATSRIKVSSGVTVLPLRHPLVQVRAATTAVELSGGRFRMGVGSGWLREEFEALGVSFEARGDRIDEILDIFEQAFAGGPFEHHGRFYQFDRVQITTEPVHVPLIFGGSKPRALRRAALRGDGWTNPTDCDLDACVRLRGDIERWRSESGGRSDAPFEYHIKIPDAPTRELIDRYADAGFEDLLVPWAKVHPGSYEGAPLADRLAALEALAEVAGLSGS